MSLSVTEQALLESMDLLAEAKIHASRAATIGCQQCSTAITDFFQKHGELHRQLRAKHDSSPRQGL